MSRTQRLRPLAGLLAMGLAAPAIAAPSVPFPTYETGLQPNGSYVVSTGQVISPAGIQVNLGNKVRAKAIALNPRPGSHTAAVLTMGAAEPVVVFDTLSGQVLQNYLPFQDTNGSYSGIAYTADGKHLMFSQDDSYITIANVGTNGMLTDAAHLSVPANTSFIKCFPNSPRGPYGAPCGQLYDGSYTSYPGGLAITKGGKSAYALLNGNNTVQPIDLTQTPPVLGQQFRVGNAPHSIVLNGNRAYVSNEGGRAATKADFTVISNGTPIVADTTNGFAAGGNVSVVNLLTSKVVATIPVGLHPTGMAMFGAYLLVLNTNSDSISVIDTATNAVARTINLGLPIAVPGQNQPAFGAGPNAIAVDANTGVAYVALYNANAIAVVDLSGGTAKPVLGMIPTAFAPASVVLDTVNKQLLIANDKGIGTRGSFEEDAGVVGYNTHQDNGTVSIVKLPTVTELAAMTKLVSQNNHWDLKANIAAASGGKNTNAPVAIPAKIGDPSFIKHVFLIIKENRTYDQILGDVAAGNGDPQLAVFGGKYTPNFHALVTRFPLLDNFYTPSRQSADGHQWIVEAMAPYADDIQSPDWIRSYPGGNAGDALAYTQKGFLWQTAISAGLSTKIYGEYGEGNNWPTPLGHPNWSQLYADALAFEAGTQTTLHYQNAAVVQSTVPSVYNHMILNFPMFDMNVPDQFRADIWLQDFNADLATGTVPALSILWITNDHTGGPPTPQAMQADNDLATGRIIDAISHSAVWSSSAIFIEEDDSQGGVDHIDGHRSPAYIVSPYAKQHGPTDHTYYTQINMTRTIEQILGLPPMNQYDLVASPMTTAFTNTADFTPWTHLDAQFPLTTGVTASIDATPMEKAWLAAKDEMFQGKTARPDAVDADTLNHFDWYASTEYKRPYPGEAKVRWPFEFASRIANPITDLDD